MPRFVAIEWDSREARVAVASARGNQAVLEDAFSVPLPLREEGKEGTESGVGAAISAALAQHKLPRTEALIAVGRTHVELKKLTLPPVPDAELPDMVRLQAVREFNSLAEDWPLDYLPLSSEPDQPRNVLAAAMSPETMAQLEQVCAAIGTKPLRMVLRPCAAASLFMRFGEAREHRVKLLVDVAAEEVDLSVLIGSDVVFLRTARLPHEAAASTEASKPLMAEIRRTLAAASNQLGGERVAAIYVCGAQAERGSMVQRLEQELSLPARVFDPMSVIGLDPILKKTPPDSVGRYTALIGMLTDEIESVPHGVDFLHPRRPPAPPSRRNVYALAAIAAMALVGLGGFVYWQLLARLDKEIAALTAQSKALEPIVKQAEQSQNSAIEIEKWTSNEISWLDELRELSQKMPIAKDAMITQMRFAPHPDGGIIHLDAELADVAVLTPLSQSLADDHHVVEGKGRQHDPKRKYPWQVSGSIVVKPRSKEDYLQALQTITKKPSTTTPGNAEPKQPTTPPARTASNR